MTNGIFWLTSYPKSGNTWLRMVLNNYIANLDEPLNINNANSSLISSNRLFFDELTGLNSSDMSEEEIKLYQPEVFIELSKNNLRDLYIKVHDSYIINKEGHPLFPDIVTKGVVYIIRNPLDVIGSYANHKNESIENIISILNNEEHKLDIQEDELNIQLPQLVRSWSSNVDSWINSKLPLKIVRYEDMIDNPYNTFYSILYFLGLDIEKKRLEKAIEFSSFKELKKQEKSNGFSEKSPKTNIFFNSGKKNSYKEYLTPKQIDDFISKNYLSMKRFSYI